SLAADAAGDVDELGDLDRLADAGLCRRRRRYALDVEGLLGCHRRSPSAHGRGGFVEVHQERLVFRRLDVGVADIGRQRVGPEALLGHACESPVDGNADGMDGLAVDGERLDALRYHGYGGNLAAVAAHLHAVAGGNALLLRQLLADLDELFRLQDGV